MGTLNAETEKAPFALTLAVGLVSGAALGLEILLMQLFSQVLWHYFAAMVISLALLGVGAGGVMLRLTRKWWINIADSVFAVMAVLFGLSAPLVFALSRRVAFNPLEVVWDPGQWARLAAVYLLLAIPFFCSGSCVGLALSSGRYAIGRIYRADLAGAGLGAAGVVGLLFVVPPDYGLKGVLAAGWLAGVLVLGLVVRRARWAVCLAVLGGASLLYPVQWVAPTMSQYKSLSRMLLVPGTEVVAEYPHPLGKVSLVTFHQTPLRHAPGLSPLCGAEPPAQQGVFVNGNMAAALPARGKAVEREFLDCLPAAAAYRLLDPESVLIIGEGSGMGPFLALSSPAREVHVVEPNSRILGLLQQEVPGSKRFVGHALEPRSFLAAEREAGFDIIHFWPEAGGGSLGAREVTADYTTTREAFAAYYRNLAPEGLMLVEHWVEHPPMVTFKLLATLRAALEAEGVFDVSSRLVLIKSLNTGLLLVKKGTFTAREVETVQSFCKRRGFEPIWPGRGSGEVDGRKRPDILAQGVAALMSEQRQAFRAASPYFIAPATDNAPYFSRFFRWRSLSGFLERITGGGAALVQWPYLIQVATLFQAAAAGIVLVLAPIMFKKRGDSWSGKGRAVVYFTALGLGFLFLEIVFIQRMTLFLGHPAYAVSAVLGGFLVFAGMGSGLSRAMGTHRAFAGVLFFVLFSLVLLPGILDALMSFPLPVRALVAVISGAPMAFFLGMPFPLGLSALERKAPGWVPWTFGVNGCASVVSPVMATLLAVHFGTGSVVILAGLLYGLAWTMFPKT